MLPIIAAMLAGAALGGAKGMSDEGKEKEDRKAAAETMRWSPWTRLNAGPIKKADMAGSILQGGMTGAMMGGQFGGAAKAAAPAASDGMAATAGTPFDGNGPTLAAQNGAPGSALSYGTSGGQGYAGYPGAGAGTNQIAYVPPGQDPSLYQQNRYPWGALAQR